jgi:hypothetical protein
MSTTPDRDALNMAAWQPILFNFVPQLPDHYTTSLSAKSDAIFFIVSIFHK